MGDGRGTPAGSGRAVLRVGAARRVITPPLGVSLAGSYSDRRAVDVHDDLYARALVVEGSGGASDGPAGSVGPDGGGDPGRQIAVVSCDLIGLRAATVAGVRRRIEQTCGIPGDHVLIAATHNHSGPLTREVDAGGLAGEPDEPYLAALERHIASAVQAAQHRLAPASLRLTLGHERGIAFNRRFEMRQGPVRTNPGKLNPDVVRPAGPVDDRVWTMTALPAGAGAGAGPLALLVNFGLHPAIVGGTVVGADFPAALESAVQRLLGWPGQPGQPGRPVVVFANAPCGDVNHVDVSHGHPQGGIAEAVRVGTVLAAEVMRGVCRLQPDLEVPGDPSAGHLAVRGARQTVALSLRRPTAAQIAWARTAANGRMSMVPGKGLEVVEAHRILALAGGAIGPHRTPGVSGTPGNPEDAGTTDSTGWGGDSRTTEVQALAVGDDLAIVGLPGEIFVELGLDLRRRSPFRNTLVLGLANDAIGYVPTRAAYDEGGYEPTASRFQPGSGERLVEAALQVLARLRA